MNLSFKYRLYPNKIQSEAIDNNLRLLRNLYNSALEERISYYKKYKKSRSKYDQYNCLSEIRSSNPEYKNLYSQSLQGCLSQIDSAYNNFFRKIKNKSVAPGFPRFKNETRFRSIIFPQCNLKSGGVKLLDKKIIIHNIPGTIRIELHRPILGKCKQVKILKQSDKYYMIAVCTDILPNPLSKTNKTIAIDLGISNFITTDDGTTFSHPKPYNKLKVKLSLKNSKLSKKKRGSNNSKRLRKTINKQYEKISNIREDFQHKLSKKIISENDIIIIEKLNIKSMLEAKGFEVDKNNITDASWGSFATKLKYKAERAGRLVIEVNPRNTSKTCSKCGKVKEKLSLKDRIYHCEACGFTLDRDHNAALNIKRLGTSPTIT